MREATEIRLDPGQLEELAGMVAAAKTPRLVDANAAAEMLGVPVSWVRQEARAGRLPHVPMGRYVRFEPAELEAWWRARQQGPAQRPVA